MRGSTYSKKKKKKKEGRVRVIYSGVRCRVQIHGGLGQLDARRVRVPVRLPQQLSGVITLLRWQEWDRRLSAHPDQRLRSHLVRGIREGFRIGFAGGAKGWQWCPTQNMQSARDQPMADGDVRHDPIRSAPIIFTALADAAEWMTR